MNSCSSDFRKCLNIRNIRTRNEQVNIVGSLVGNHRFQVHHMAHDGVLARNAHATAHLLASLLCTLLAQPGNFFPADGSYFGPVINGKQE